MLKINAFLDRFPDLNAAISFHCGQLGDHLSAANGPKFSLTVRDSKWPKGTEREERMRLKKWQWFTCGELCAVRNVQRSVRTIGKFFGGVWQTRSVKSWHSSESIAATIKN
jgi:hypothetical protein